MFDDARRQPMSEPRTTQRNSMSTSAHGLLASTAQSPSPSELLEFVRKYPPPGEAPRPRCTRAARPAKVQPLLSTSTHAPMSCAFHTASFHFSSAGTSPLPCLQRVHAMLTHD